MTRKKYKTAHPDLAFMEQAFAEARAVKGHTLPNPAVGAILVKNGKIVGRGGTRPAGDAHAEIVALRQAGASAAGATLYVTLEPCDHYGRTPPCSRALIEAGVARVVAACVDPNPKVSGKGLARLRRAGVAVETGLLGDLAAEFYAGFFFWVQHGRPRIVLKIAQSLDGRINARRGIQTALTGPEARVFAHSLRARADALLVGGATVRIDDPDLTPREIAGAPSPEVLVLTRRLKAKAETRVFAANRPSKTWLIGPDKGSQSTRKHAENVHVGHLALPKSRSLGRSLLKVFQERGYHEVLVEGGRGVWAPFLKEGLCDVLYVITAPVLCPGGERWEEDLGLKWVKPLEFHRFTPLGSDALSEFRRVP